MRVNSVEEELRTVNGSYVCFELASILEGALELTGIRDQEPVTETALVAGITGYEADR